MVFTLIISVILKRLDVIMTLVAISSMVKERIKLLGVERT